MYRTASMAADTFYYYIYEKNLQGDIVAIYNIDGERLVSYKYDAWGNVSVSNHNISGTNAGAQYNPLRYRGYYYDEEIGLYYLNSRYYDPRTGRFLNADDTAYLGADGTPLSYNLFAYCGNNPVMYSDKSGHLPEWLEDAVDVGLYIVSAAEALAVASTAPTVAAKVATFITVFGATNNFVNGLYYNFISDGQSDLTSSSYTTDLFINRWDRLDYVKQQEEMPSTYNKTASMYFSEYNLHMYGWRLAGWSLDKKIIGFSDVAESCKDAYVIVGKQDGRPEVDIPSAILRWLGV